MLMASVIKLAGGVIRDEKGRILLLHRNTATHNHWEIPGGKIETWETAQQAAIREIKEELGVNVRIIQPLGAKEFQDDNKTFHYTWFMAEITSGKPKIMEPEIFDDLQFLAVEKVSVVNLSTGAKAFFAMLGT